MDNYTKAYLSVVNEWNSNGVLKTYPLPNVALAVKEATHDFILGWSKGSSSRKVRESAFLAKDLSEAEVEEGQHLLLDAFEFWKDKSGEFEDKVKPLFQAFECQEDSIGLLAYAI